MLVISGVGSAPMRTAMQAPRPSKYTGTRPEADQAPAKGSTGNDDVEALLRYARAARLAASHANHGNAPRDPPPGLQTYVGQERLILRERIAGFG